MLIRIDELLRNITAVVYIMKMELPGCCGGG